MVFLMSINCFSFQLSLYKFVLNYIKSFKASSKTFVSENFSFYSFLMQCSYEVFLENTKEKRKSCFAANKLFFRQFVLKQSNESNGVKFYLYFAVLLVNLFSSVLCYIMEFVFRFYVGILPLSKEHVS